MGLENYGDARMRLIRIGSKALRAVRKRIPYWGDKSQDFLMSAWEMMETLKDEKENYHVGLHGFVPLLIPRSCDWP